MAMTYSDMSTFIHDFEDKAIRYWVKKSVFTPFEMDKKFSDQSTYECDIASIGFIKLAVDLGCGDYLLGIRPFYNDGGEQDEDLFFFRLSEIRFQICEIDQIEEEGDQE